MKTRLILAAVLAAAAAGVTLIVTHWLGTLHFLGARPTPVGTAPMYQLWSGFVPALVIVTLPVGAVTWYYHHTCHARPSCLRWGKYEAAGGMFRLCHRHHPDLAGRKPHQHGGLIGELHRRVG